ncbi:dipeptidyl aminopeptidase/acylaminoacyl peptidase [Thermoflavifilum aggregans]|uniref:Dipeptidyl aminopeptidase/acylaminoacyl peptidase n=1 Tax=Thermoflavifilum aggregans TaxID=454188 RepID=A0A2M9CW31_9BACT|nr:prolyl oligopeptidase family serine peptidase [Thermoflavifilum aggregans]PJJ76008.1 dipeptidyl aminopeptidase/acylaminoacyl peptidase [Thermoflavifilum aggregans]
MKTWIYLLLCLSTLGLRVSAQRLDSLTIEQIMSDPKWIGTSPSDPFWSPDGQKLYFSWNPEQAPEDSLYYITLTNHQPVKASPAERLQALAQRSGTYDHTFRQLVYSQQGQIYWLHVPTHRLRQITHTAEMAFHPMFAFHDRKIVFQQGDNLFAWDTATGELSQLTLFIHAEKSGAAPHTSPQDVFLEKDALENSVVLQQRKQRKAEEQQAEKNLNSFRNLPDSIFIGSQRVAGLNISPDGRFITYQLIKEPRDVQRTIIPEYVTQSGYTETIPGRTKVGAPQPEMHMWIYDRLRDSTYEVDTHDIPGIHDKPDYLKDYPSEDSAWDAHPPFRKVIVNGPLWSPESPTDGSSHALVVVRSQDNKDRWIMEIHPETGKLTLMDRQRDEAWIAGPGIGWNYSMGNVGWINDHICWFQSEATGYSHLYLYDLLTHQKRALTSGKYEVQTATLSRDKKSFYITTNAVEPGQTQFYRLDIATGRQTRLTHEEGGNRVELSPDEKWLAVLHSFSNHPWELFLQRNDPAAQPEQITHLAESPLFRSYPWRAPEIITFRDRDGYRVYARLFRPRQPASTHPGVLFVHGAGYLQDAHKWWSDYYFREYMFENLLADHGYTVMDVDYRGSAGYGRDWRTAIYRHMGGKDLDDEVDAARFMADSLGVDPHHIGIWGGSYGGFMTLMALFTQPGVFKCGAALRSVTDWAHYNHGYTSDILNEPYTDSLAYKRSSPIYFAAGLQDHLLMCHGMEDTNVHFQDIVRLTEKLIELGKDNWELAVYPLEDHEFKDPSSWTDEYKRIFHLFETNLK